MTEWQPHPTEKSPQVEDLLTKLFGVNRRESITEKVCVSCGTENLTEESFRDELSLREFHISGLCQNCQDSVFGTNEDENNA